MSLQRSWWTLLILAVSTVIVGCHKEETGTGALPTQPAQPTGAAGQGDSGGKEVAFTTADGWTIHGDYTPIPGAKGTVVLLHQRGGSAADWRPLTEKLNAAGVATLALDQRGAGRSQGRENGDNAPWDTSQDIAGAVEWLHKSGFTGHVGLAGASYGANNALLYAAAHADIPAVALLSPGTDYHGLKVGPAATRYRGALLILSASGDTITGGGPETIRHAAPIPPNVQSYAGDAHGTGLFSAHPESLQTLTDFFKTKL